jgi:glucosyl-dolichyl phosphate glucuronosyltransferase
MSRNVPTLSIVVPTLGRLVHLRALLRALEQQDVPTDVFEVVVVDNEAEPNADVRLLCNGSELNVSYHHQPALGVSAARNLGVAKARADLIGFLDDDTLPARDWVHSVIAIQAARKASILGGPFTPFYTGAPPKWFRDSYASLDYGDQARWLRAREYLATANLVCTREVFNTLGAFSEKFGYVGSNKRYGEDTEWQQRATLVGMQIWYDPALRVLHHFETERMRVSWFLSSQVRHGKTKAAILIKEPGVVDDRPRYRQVLTVLKKFCLSVLRLVSAGVVVFFRSRAKYPYYQNYLVEVVGHEIKQLSLYSELIRLLRMSGSGEGRAA